VCRLFSFFEQNLGPLVTQKDFNVLYIGSNKLFKGHQSAIKKGFFVPNNRAGTPWVYHVALERDGLIYDLDFTSTPIVLTVKEYADLFLSGAHKEGILFNPSFKRSLRILKIPGEEYLDLTSFALLTEAFHESLYHTYPNLTLKELVSLYTKESEDD
jgi:hypothetical protein